MIVFLLGMVSFTMFFVYDLNDALWRRPILYKLFLAGNMVLAGVTIWVIYLSNLKIAVSPRTIAGVLLFFIFLWLLFYTLFGALPMEETYSCTEKKRNVYMEGVYALCRHPGVLWLGGMYGMLAMVLGTVESRQLFIITTLCNVGYVIFQDYWTFPRVFQNYEKYKMCTPFLIPNVGSMKRCVQTIRKG